MGKGFNNFMSKKAFHPGSYQNQKRIHEAEARAEAKRKHDEETLAQYQKEQELFNQKSLVSKESKEKLSLNFMYDAPPGVEKANDKKSGKSEWKGSGTASEGHYEAIKLEKASIKGETSGITLEWKRDRPVKNSAQAKRGQESEDRGEKAKSEPVIDLKPKLETLATDQHKPSTSRRSPETSSANAKRVKRER